MKLIQTHCMYRFFFTIYLKLKKNHEAFLTYHHLFLYRDKIVFFI